MSITPGTRVGAYDILAKLGEGGPPSLAQASSELRRDLAVAQRGSTW